MRVFERGHGEGKRASAHRPAVLSVGEEFLDGAGGPGVNWPEDLAGVAPLVLTESPEKRLISTRHSVGAELESFRLLGHRLRAVQKAAGANRVLITSSIPGEGKTVVASNLALSLARGSERVLLLEADLRKPGNGGAFADESLPGVADWMEGRLTLPEVIRRIEGHNLWILPSGVAERNPGELIQEPAFRQLLDSAGRRFDWVLVDSPPLNPFIDAHLLVGMTDTTMLVVRSGTTAGPVYENTLKQLKGVPLAGVVLNAYEDADRKSYYAYYPAGR